jgi:hypothetical protein
MKQVDQDFYLKFKEDVLQGNIVTRTDLPVSALEIDNLKAISFNNVVLILSPSATKGLMKAMGVSNTLIEMLKNTYNDSKLLNTILSHIRAAKKSSKTITLVYNKKVKMITAVYAAQAKVISDQQYFDSLEALLDKTPGAFLRNIAMSPEGNLQAILSNPNLEFQFGNKKDEIFSAGITFDLNTQGLTTNFFTERKVCSNGAVTQDKLCSKSVKYNSEVPDFLQAILSKDYYLTSIHEFKTRINRCYYTPAALSEVLSVESKVRSILGNYYEILSDKTSFERLRNTFGEEYLLATHNHDYLRTDLTLWQLTNEITAISSRIERNHVAVSENTNMKLQIVGGDLMFRKPKLASSQIKQIF